MDPVGGRFYECGIETPDSISHIFSELLCNINGKDREIWYCEAENIFPSYIESVTRRDRTFYGLFPVHFYPLSLSSGLRS